MMGSIVHSAAFGVLAVGGGFLLLAMAVGYWLRVLLRPGAHSSGGRMMGGPMMGGPMMGGRMMGRGMMGRGMMGSTTFADMSTYMGLFSRHAEISRTVDQIPGGVRTTTESESPDLVARLQDHVSSMYEHLAQRAEVACMSDSLPTLFRGEGSYERKLTLTSKGVSVTETSTDPVLTRAIREHADEVSGFVRDGMPAMMRGMMGC